jgi:hypothetical protein
MAAPLLDDELLDEDDELLDDDDELLDDDDELLEDDDELLDGALGLPEEDELLDEPLFDIFESVLPPHEAKEKRVKQPANKRSLRLSSVLKIPIIISPLR